MGSFRRTYGSSGTTSPRHHSLVQECGLVDGNSVCGRGMTRLIVKTDWEKCLCDDQSTAMAAEIASSTSWLKLLDMALDHGHQGTVSLQALFQGTN